jgi:putative copper export protein
MYTLLVLLHVLGACIWVGGHLVLALAVLPRALRRRDPAVVLGFEGGFERLGIPALLVQAATGILLARHWAPDLWHWSMPPSPQAAVLHLKLGLLAATVLLGAHARLRLIPRLTPDTLPALAAHIIAVTLLGVAFVVAGVVLRTGAY